MRARLDALAEELIPHAFERALGCFRSLDGRTYDAALAEKASYHSVRALVFASDWLRAGRCPGSTRPLRV